MKKAIIFIIAIFLLSAGVYLLFQTVDLLRPKGKGALRVASNIKSDVFLNGQKIGITPLCKCEDSDTLNEGDYQLNIVPQDKSLSPFSSRIKIGSGVLTAVDKTFLPGSLASSYVLTLEKTNSVTPQLFVTSIPDGSLVSIDGNPAGATPFFNKNLPDSEHELEIQKNGYSKKTIRIKTVPAYKLIVNVILGSQTSSDDQFQEASSSSNLKMDKSSSPSSSIKIIDTPTGFLRVRKEPSTSSDEVARVNPGDILPLLEEKDGWYKIQTKDKAQGWVSGNYSEKVTQ